MNTDIELALGKLSRRIDTMQKSVDLLNNDRNMFEDILTRLSALEQAQHLNRNHQTEMTKDIKAEIRESGALVENTVHDIEAKIDDKTMIIKSSTDNIFKKLLKKLGGGI